MTDEYALKIVDALERLWMENQAMGELLDLHEIPDWFGLVQSYCNQKENQDEVRQRFAPARALLRAALKGSKDQSELLAMFAKANQEKKPN